MRLASALASPTFLRALVVHALLLTGCSADADLTLGRAYACDPTAEDRSGAPQCAEGWRCTQQGLCIQEAVGQPASCLRDDDCKGGFVCGREGLCRDPEVNGPYQCLHDTDCTPSWVCGVAAFCIDPSLEAEPPPSAQSALTSAQRISPVGDSPPELFALSLPGNARHYGGVTYDEGWLRGFAVQDPQRREHSLQGSLSPRHPVDPIAAWELPVAAAPRFVGAIRPDIAVALLPDGLWVGDGGVRLTAPELAGMEQLTLTPEFGSQAVFTGYTAGSVVAGRVSPAGTQVFVLGASGEKVVPGPSGAAIEDADQFIYSGDSSAGIAVVATTDRGLYLKLPGAGAPWAPVATGGLAHADCPSQSGEWWPTGILHTGIRVTYRLHVIAAPGGGGPERRAFQLNGQAGVSNGCDARYAGMVLAPTAPSCELCPPGDRLVDARETSTSNVLHARCANTAGVERSYAVTLATPCQRVEWFESMGTLPTEVNASARGSKAFATPEGRLYGGVAPGDRALPVHLAQAPSQLLRVAGRLSAGVFAEPSPALSQEYAEAPGFGLVRTSPTANDRPLPTGPEVEPRYLIETRQRTVRELAGWADGGVPAVVARLDSTHLEGFQLPATLNEAPLPDGGTTVVVTSFDVLLSAEVSSDAAQPAILTTRLSPAPRSAIRDVTLTRPQTGAVLEGYLLTDNAVFFVRALSEQRWESTEVPVPAGDRIALWSSGGLARLGYRDGSVFSLPGRLRLAPPLSNETASDFARVCGRIYAATSQGLRRLDPSGGGTWVVEPAFAGAPQPELSGARLFTTANELFWVGAGGTVIRLAAPETACAAEDWP